MTASSRPTPRQRINRLGGSISKNARNAGNYGREGLRRGRDKLGRQRWLKVAQSPFAPRTKTSEGGAIGSGTTRGLFKRNVLASVASGAELGLAVSRANDRRKGKRKGDRTGLGEDSTKIIGGLGGAVLGEEAGRRLFMRRYKNKPVKRSQKQAKIDADNARRASGKFNTREKIGNAGRTARSSVQSKIGDARSKVIKNIGERSNRIDVGKASKLDSGIYRATNAARSGKNATKRAAGSISGVVGSGRKKVGDVMGAGSARAKTIVSSASARKNNARQNLSRRIIKNSRSKKGGVKLGSRVALGAIKQTKNVDKFFGRQAKLAGRLGVKGIARHGLKGAAVGALGIATGFAASRITRKIGKKADEIATRRKAAKSR